MEGFVANVLSVFKEEEGCAFGRCSMAARRLRCKIGTVLL